MKAIFDGLRYDTAKAELIGEGGPLGLSRSDFTWWEAGLYRTPRSKRFFLAGKGGPMTRFARPAGNSAYSGGERIFPLSEDAAREWAERHLTADEVEAAFAIEDA